MSDGLQDLHKGLVGLVLELDNLRLHVLFGSSASRADEIAVLVGLETAAGVGFAVVHLLLPPQR